MKIINGWIDEALDGHYGAKSNSRQGYTPKFIVLHGTAGGSSAQGIDDFFTNGKDANGQPVQASSHIIIDQQAVVIQGISLDMAAWANCCLSGSYASYLNSSINQNLYTISIEHVKSSTDNSDQLTQAQQDASFRVIECICDAYGIPKRAGDGNGGIIDHADIDPINRSRCPGPYPHDELYAFLNGGNTTMSGIPQGWSDDGATLTAPNGHKFVRGFRDKVLSSNWNPENQPTSEEYAANPAQLHRPDLGPGTRIVCRDDEMWWTPGTGVIHEQFTGLELDAAYKALSDANAQIAALKAEIADAKIDVQAVHDMQAIQQIADKYK